MFTDVQRGFGCVLASGLALTVLLGTASTRVDAALSHKTQASTSATAPVSLRYFAPNAYRVDVDVHHSRTGTKLTKPMQYRDYSDMFHVKLPQGLFKKNDPLVLTFRPRNKFNNPMPPYTVNYTVGQTPEYFADTAVNNSPIRVRTLQKHRGTSPTVHVYLPSKPSKSNPERLYSSDELIAARLHQSDSSLISFHSLRPVPRQNDWYELQVPAFWFGQGETIVVDLVASKKLAKHSQQGLFSGQPSDLRTLHSFTYKTLSNEVLEKPDTPLLELSQ